MSLKSAQLELGFSIFLKTYSGLGCCPFKEGDYVVDDLWFIVAPIVCVCGGGVVF